MQKLEALLSARGIEYRVSGDNEILTRCPLCGSSDPSQHLAISLRNRGWRCLRNPAHHKGRSYQRLLTMLLHCSMEDAAALLGERLQEPLPDNDNFGQMWRKQLGFSDENSKPTQGRLLFPREFKRLYREAPLARGFWNYLYDRGYSPVLGEWAAKNYDLQYAISGKYAYRIIVPIYSAARKLMTWTARSIQPKANIRYLSLKREEALAYPGELLLGLPLLWRATLTKCLVVCEGPFDAIAVSTLGHRHGVYGTCLFGLELSDKQTDLLAELGDRFERMRLLIDPEAWTRILSLRTQLPRRCKPLSVPKGFDDPGDLIKNRAGEEFVLSLAEA